MSLQNRLFIPRVQIAGPVAMKRLLANSLNAGAETNRVQALFPNAVKIVLTWSNELAI